MRFQHLLLSAAAALVGGAGLFAVAGGLSSASASGLERPDLAALPNDGDPPVFNPPFFIPLFPADDDEPEGVIGDAIAIFQCPDGSFVEYDPGQVLNPEELCPTVLGDPIALIVCPDGTEVVYNPAEVADPEELCPPLLGEPPYDPSLDPDAVDDDHDGRDDGRSRGNDGRETNDRDDSTDDTPGRDRDRDNESRDDADRLPQVEEAPRYEGEAPLPPKAGSAAVVAVSYYDVGILALALLLVGAGGALLAVLLRR
jgi:hypothetical protein